MNAGFVNPFFSNITVLDESTSPVKLPLGVSITPDLSKICIPADFTPGVNYFSIQLCLSMTVSVISNILLKPLGVPTYVSHLVAGCVMGPSILGQIQGYTTAFLNITTSHMLDTYSIFSMIFQMFLIGVQINPSFVLRPGKKAACIGTLVVVIPMALATAAASSAKAFLHITDPELSESLFSIAFVQSISSFPVIVFYMYELNIVSLEFSHTAYACSMVSGALCASLMGATTFFHTNSELVERLLSFVSHVGVFLLIFYVLRPSINSIISRVPEGETVKEAYMFHVYLAVLTVSLFSILGNVNWMFGPLILGMMIPSRSSLGTTLVKRFTIFNTWLMMPIFYLSHGAMLDLSKLHSGEALIMEFIVVVSYLGKFLGAFLPALYYKMSLKEAILLGLTVNAQGFLEVANYGFLKRLKAINVRAFEVMSTSMIVMALILTPLLKYLYKSLGNKVEMRGNQSAEPNMDLRVVACVYNQENVPSIIHLLKALHPTKDNRTNVSLIHFVERIGHATPLIINHTLQTHQSSAAAGSQRIINVFKMYEERNRESTSVHPYTIVSHYTSLPNHVCTLSEQQMTSLIILPFYKDVATGILNPDRRMVNCEVLDKADCSVGILIDRGLQRGIKSVLEDWTSYRVVMIFFGGADDREALMHAAKMSTHPTIELTVIRILADYANATYTAKTEMAIDDEMISDFKRTQACNRRIIFVEEKVEKGLGVIKLFESMEDKYQLIMFGRHHDQKSPLILGLTEWNECSEIGIIGDIFTSSNYGGKASIFIMQSQKNASRRACSFAQDEEVMKRSYEEEIPLQDQDKISSS